MSHIAIINKPPFCTLQDAGRFGAHHLGITTGGPLDHYAHYAANALVGNLTNSFVHAATCQSLEATFGNLELDMQTHCCAAVTGAEARVQLNGADAPQWQSFAVCPGDHLQIGPTQKGLRTYVAFSGQFTLPPTLSSCATVVREGLGGIDGTALAQGDVLPIAATAGLRRRWQQDYVPALPSLLTLRFVSGYQWHRFSDDFRQWFSQQTYRVSTKSDRMGCRLEGPLHNHPQLRSLSEGISLGSIQLPPDGQPIVLLQDRQTIGGYSKLGAVLSTDLNRLAQAVPGTPLTFSPITQSRAQQHLQSYRKKFVNAVHSMACS